MAGPEDSAASAYREKGIYTALKAVPPSEQLAPAETDGINPESQTHLAGTTFWVLPYPFQALTSVTCHDANKNRWLTTIASVPLGTFLTFSHSLLPLTTHFPLEVTFKLLS